VACSLGIINIIKWGRMISNIEQELFEIGFQADKEAQKQNFFIEKEFNKLKKEKRHYESQKH
jgi:hypothetical protein